MPAPPPALARASNWLSLRLRAQGRTESLSEWLASTGFSAASSVSQNLMQDFLGIKMSQKTTMIVARLPVTMGMVWEYMKLGIDSPSTSAHYLVLAPLFILLFLALVFTMVRRVERSWMGLAMDAVRLDETASACFGINIVRWKVTAFTMGNVLMGMAGALYAMMLAYISPANFTFSDSLLFLSILLLGGMGNCWGVLLATSIMVVLPEKLQFIQEYRYLLYSLLVLLMIVYRPMGLLPRRTRVVTSEDVA